MTLVSVFFVCAISIFENRNKTVKEKEARSMESRIEFILSVFWGPAAEGPLADKVWGIH